MKILAIADVEQNELWDRWDTVGKSRLAGVDLILSAGDLMPAYLEFLVTMTSVPLLYVRGNHDGRYDTEPPEGCLDIDGLVCEYMGIRIAGLGGSMRYRDGGEMYTEDEMSARTGALLRKIKSGRGVVRTDGSRPGFFGSLKILCGLGNADQAPGYKGAGKGRLDILLTHAPCRGYGDLDDLPHRGFECFNRLLEEVRPAVHCYGHVHMDYGRIKRETEHITGTRLINCSGLTIFDI